MHSCIRPCFLSLTESKLGAGVKSEPHDMVDKFNFPEGTKRMVRKHALSDLTAPGGDPASCCAAAARGDS